MRRNLGPVVRRELENLDKDADSRKTAMRALKSYVKDMDSKAIPLFLAQVSESKETGSSAGEHTISLYEVLARVHGPKIVPQIENIMTTIIKTLTSSAGSFALHQACSKVVPAIARYGIDPTTPEDKKKHIIHSLCKPLSDSLLASQESLSSGSALCLKALVDSDNWRFASSEMVNEVCQRVAGALEKPMQTNSHIGLIMALAKNNSLIIEAYARLLIQSGLRLLSAGVAEGNSQKRLTAIQMVNFLMKCLDPKSIFSELGLVMAEMDKCQSDQMAYVKGAAFEALQTAKKIISEKGSKFERDTNSITGSDYYSRGNSPRRILWGIGDQSPRSASPESHTVDSSVGHDSFMESPFSNSCASGYLSYDRRSVNRKHWRRDNSDLDVSLKDGIFSDLTPRSVIDNSENDQFSGFCWGSPRNAGMRSTTPSPQRSRSNISVGNVKIYTTPRKLVRSLQDPSSGNSEISEKQSRRFRSPYSSKNTSPASKYEQNGFSYHPAAKYDQNIFLSDVNHDTRVDEELPGDKEVNSSSESVSSSEIVPVSADVGVSQMLVSGVKTDSPAINVQKDHGRFVFSMLLGFFIVIFAASVCLLWIDGVEDESYNLPPT